VDRDGELDRNLDTTPVRYGPRRPVHTKLDAYKAIIETRLAAYPELSAVRLLSEIRAAGYEGSYTQLKEFVRQVRPTPPADLVIRFETPAGRQAQVDFARFSFAWGVRYALLVVLGYSRLLWCRFYPRQDMRTLIEGLRMRFVFYSSHSSNRRAAAARQRAIGGSTRAPRREQPGLAPFPIAHTRTIVDAKNEGDTCADASFAR
jgi:hypothetical protein